MSAPHRSPILNLAHPCSPIFQLTLRAIRDPYDELPLDDRRCVYGHHGHRFGDTSPLWHSFCALHCKAEHGIINIVKIYSKNRWAGALKCAGALAVVTTIVCVGGCKRKHANTRILGDISTRYVLKGATMEVLGHKVPIPEATDKTELFDKSTVYVDIPMDSLPKERPIVVTLRLPTPCGDFEKKISINDAEPNDQGVMHFKEPDTLPVLTELHFAPGMKGSVRIGQQEIVPAKRVPLLNLECATTLSIGGGGDADAGLQEYEQFVFFSRGQLDIGHRSAGSMLFGRTNGVR